MKPRKIRRLLAWLFGLDILLDYQLDTRHGQSVMIRDRGRPRIMRLGTAMAVAREMERREWWGCQ